MHKRDFDHSFSVDAAMVRNDLLHEVLSAPTLALFRKKWLKSHLFKKAFPNLAYTLFGTVVVLDLAT